MCRGGGRGCRHEDDECAKCHDGRGPYDHKMATISTGRDCKNGKEDESNRISCSYDESVCFVHNTDLLSEVVIRAEEKHDLPNTVPRAIAKLGPRLKREWWNMPVRMNFHS